MRDHRHGGEGYDVMVQLVVDQEFEGRTYRQSTAVLLGGRFRELTNPVDLICEVRDLASALPALLLGRAGLEWDGHPVKVEPQLQSRSFVCRVGAKPGPALRRSLPAPPAETRSSK